MTGHPWMANRNLEIAMKTTEQRDAEREALAAYLNERGLSAPEAVALLCNAAAEIMGQAIDEGKISAASADVRLEQAAQQMRRTAGISHGSTAH